MVKLSFVNSLTISFNSWIRSSYVRIINNNEAEVTFDLNKFIVNTVEIKEKSITSSNFSIDKPLNVFDGDLTTATAYQGSQNVGKYFTYDLGQEITLNSFKAICTDSFTWVILILIT